MLAVSQGTYFYPNELFWSKEIQVPSEELGAQKRILFGESIQGILRSPVGASLGLRACMRDSFVVMRRIDPATGKLAKLSKPDRMAACGQAAGAQRWPTNEEHDGQGLSQEHGEEGQEQGEAGDEEGGGEVDYYGEEDYVEDDGADYGAGNGEDHGYVEDLAGEEYAGEELAGEEEYDSELYDGGEV